MLGLLRPNEKLQPGSLGVWDTSPEQRWSRSKKQALPDVADARRGGPAVSLFAGAVPQLRKSLVGLARWQGNLCPARRNLDAMNKKTGKRTPRLPAGEWL